jgi:aspartokinase
MPTISSAIKEIVDSKPMLYEAITQGIVNYANLAENLKQEIEMMTGEKVELPAIVMSLRRYSERMKPVQEKKMPFSYKTEIVMKTGLMDISFVKTPSLLSQLKKLYDLTDHDKSETLNIIQGNYEITVIVNEKHKQEVITLLKGEKVLNQEKGLVSFTMSLSRDYFYSPGVLAKITRALAWENINIMEVISTMTELTFIVGQNEAMKAYKTLQLLVNDERSN